MAKNQEFRDLSQPSSDAAPADPPAATSPATTEKSAVYAVAPGKTITTLRGPAHAGKQLTARDFVRGQKAIDELVASGDILKT